MGKRKITMRVPLPIYHHSTTGSASEIGPQNVVQHSQQGELQNADGVRSGSNPSSPVGTGFQRAGESTARTRIGDYVPSRITDRPITEEPGSLEGSSASYFPRRYSHQLSGTITPISMKSKDSAKALGVPVGGVDNLVLKLATKKASGSGTKKKEKRNFLAVTRVDGKYVTDSPGTDGSRHPDGKYIFIRMMNGELRLGSAKDGGNTAHATLSSLSLDVMYAGEIEFDKGRLSWFSNKSGTYLPEAGLVHQAGFDEEEMKLFRDDSKPPLRWPGAES
jgi:hypothetical protein